MPALFFLFSIFLFSCNNDDSPTSSSDSIIPKLYVCDQFNDKVIVLDASTIDLDEIYSIDINFTSDPEDSEVPHHITIDEENGYWFVATTQAGYIGMYDLSSDTLINSAYVGAMPALLTVDKSNKILYASKSSMETEMNTSNQIDVLSYDIDGLVVEEAIILSEIINDFRKPHAISLDANTSMGSSLVTASYENDWMARVTDYSGHVSSTSTLTRIGLEVDDGSSLDTSNKYKPIAAAQKDDFIFLSCVGDSSDIKSQVQIWNLSELQGGPIDSLEFSINSRLWHITPSPIDTNVYVVLKGYSNVSSSSGLASFGYDSSGTLTLNWQKTDSSFDGLHGVAISADGSRLYVSSKGNGSMHVFNSSGQLLNSIPNVGGATKDLTGIALVQVP